MSEIYVIESKNREAFEKFSKQVGFVNTVEDWAKKHKLNIYVATREHNEIKDGIVKEINNRSYSTILDVGCGYGFLLSKLKIYPQERFIVGGDISKFQVYNARDRGVEAHLVIFCAEYIPFKDNVFESVVCSEVIEHVMNPKLSILEMNRLLKKDGLLCVSTDNPSSLWRKIWDSFSNLIGFKTTVKEEYIAPDYLLNLCPANLKVCKIHMTCPYPLLPAFGPFKSKIVGVFWLTIWRAIGNLPYLGNHFYNKYALFWIKE